jgi:hypothetical protein
MKSEAFSHEVNLPDVDDFLKSYSRYTTLTGGAGKKIFDSIIQPEVFIKASVISDIGLPAVLSVANESKNIATNESDLTLDNFTKQFIGSVVCSLMEANGYEKTGKKRRVPHESFSVGECYRKVGY